MVPQVTESAPNGLHKMTFRCETCGTETERIFKQAR
jgi:hypothetical protein